jgi:hypothetical protein
MNPLKDSSMRWESMDSERSDLFFVINKFIKMGCSESKEIDSDNSIKNGSDSLEEKKGGAKKPDKKGDKDKPTDHFPTRKDYPKQRADPPPDPVEKLSEHYTECINVEEFAYAQEPNQRAR